MQSGTRQIDAPVARLFSFSLSFDPSRPSRGRRVRAKEEIISAFVSFPSASRALRALSLLDPDESIDLAVETGNRSGEIAAKSLGNADSFGTLSVPSRPTPP